MNRVSLNAGGNISGRSRMGMLMEHSLDWIGRVVRETRRS